MPELGRVFRHDAAFPQPFQLVADLPHHLSRDEVHCVLVLGERLFEAGVRAFVRGLVQTAQHQQLGVGVQFGQETAGVANVEHVLQNHHGKFGHCPVAGAAALLVGSVQRLGQGAAVPMHGRYDAG